MIAPGVIAPKMRASTGARSSRSAALIERAVQLLMADQGFGDVIRFSRSVGWMRAIRPEP